MAIGRPPAAPLLLRRARKGEDRSFRPSVALSNAAPQLSSCCHSSITQHFLWINVGAADKATKHTKRHCSDCEGINVGKCHSQSDLGNSDSVIKLINIPKNVSTTPSAILSSLGANLSPSRYIVTKSPLITRSNIMGIPIEKAADIVVTFFPLI